MAEEVYIKGDAEVLDYHVDWTAWLNGDTITTSTWIVTVGITVDSESETTSISTIWLSGGAIGNRAQDDRQKGQQDA